jgi:hypothetical protein
LASGLLDPDQDLAQLASSRRSLIEWVAAQRIVSTVYLEEIEVEDFPPERL